MGLLDELLLGSPGTGGERAAQAQKLSQSDRNFVMNQLARRQAGIAESTRQSMGMSMGGQAAAANAARVAQEKALANVAKYTNNPLALASAAAQVGTSGLLGQIYSQGAAQRAGILQQEQGLLAQAEGLATQGRTAATQGEQNVLAAIQDAQPGMLGDLITSYMGMKGMQGMGGGKQGNLTDTLMGFFGFGG